MLFFIKTIIKVITLYLITISFHSHSLNISQDTVVKRILSDSLEYKKIQAHKEAQLQSVAEAEAFLDWRFFINTNFNSQESNTLSVFENPLREQIEAVTGLEKKFFTGTKIKMQYRHFHIDREFTPEFKNSALLPPQPLRKGWSFR